jgi:hypothetical protein
MGISLKSTKVGKSQKSTIILYGDDGEVKVKFLISGAIVGKDKDAVPVKMVMTLRGDDLPSTSEYRLKCDSTN